MIAGQSVKHVPRENKAISGKLNNYYSSIFCTEVVKEIAIVDLFHMASWKSSYIEEPLKFFQKKNKVFSNRFPRLAGSNLVFLKEQL